MLDLLIKSAKQRGLKCELLATGREASLNEMLPIFQRNLAQQMRGTSERYLSINFSVSRFQ